MAKLGFMGLGIMLGLAFLFLPDWIAPFIRGILLHYSFNPGISSTDILASWSPVVGSLDCEPDTGGNSITGHPDAP